MPRPTSARNTRIESLEPLVLMSANTIDGTDASEWISGTDADDTIAAGDGDDQLHAPVGNNVIDGGSGNDTFVVYEGTQEEYQVARNPDGSVTVSGKGLSGQQTSSQLRNVEQILFTDGILELTEPDDDTEDDVSGSEKGSQTGKSVSTPEAAPAPLTSVNQAPVTQTASYTSNRGESVLGNVLSDNADGEHDVVVVAVLNETQHGSLLLSADGTFSYVPNADFDGTDSFEYRLTDKDGASSMGHVNITVTRSAANVSDSQIAVKDNITPIAVNDGFEADSDTTLFGNVSVNDSDPDGQHYELTYRLLAGPRHGKFNLYGDGSFDYTPNAAGASSDSFEYEVTDIDGAKNTATATISMKGGSANVPAETKPPVAEPPAIEPPVVAPPAAEPPAAEPWTPQRNAAVSGLDADFDIFAVTPSTLLTGNLLLNDTGSGESEVFVSEYSKTQHGAVTVGTDGTFSYFGAGGYSGIDYFHYAVSDGTQTDRATVVIHVNTDGQVPVETTELFVTNMVISPIVFDLNNDGLINVTGQTTAQDKSGITSIGKTIEFDMDADGHKESIEWIDGTGDGILVDTSQFLGTDIDGRALFGDEGGKYANGFVKLALKDTDGSELLENGELAQLRLWIDNGDGELQSNELDTLQQHGLHSVSTRMTLTADGLMRSWAFTTNDEQILIEDVWFAENDPDNDDDPSEPDDEGNLAPDADADVYSGKDGQQITGSVLSNDRDPDGDTLRVVTHSKPVHGTLSIDDNGEFAYTPDSGFSGVDYFQYQISDGRGGSDTAIVMLKIQDDSTTTGAASGGNVIEGTVWRDWSHVQATTNHDGIRDAAETSRGSSVFVSLLDTNGVVLQSVHTDSLGAYEFNALPDGVYQAKISIASLPGLGSQSGRLTLRDVNSNFFDAVDSDFDPTSGESGFITFDASTDSINAVTLDAGFYYA